MNLRTLFQEIRVILAKELLGHIRDSRSILAALVLPVLGPLCFALSMFALASFMKEEPLEIPVQGASLAPSLISHLTSQGIGVRPVSESPEAEVKSGKAKVGLIVSPNFQRDLQAGLPASLTLVSDRSRTSAAKDIRRVQMALAAWSGRLGTLRLLARGIDPRLAQPAAISELDVATPAERAAQMLAMIPLFLMMSAFIGGQNLIIDMTAGERERGSFEPFLMTSVSRTAAVIGKWAAAVIASLSVTLLCLLGFSLALLFVPLAELGIPFALSPGCALTLTAILTPLAFVGAAAEFAVSTFTRSFKEAQTYLSFFSLIPAIPAMIVIFRPFDSAGWMSAVPILAQQALCLDVLKMKPISPLSMALLCLSSAAITALILIWSKSLFQKEAVIYGRGN